MSQDIENQKITSLKHTAITPRLRQNERNQGFLHVGQWKQFKHVAILFRCSRFVVHNDVRRCNWAENTFVRTTKGNDAKTGPFNFCLAITPVVLDVIYNCQPTQKFKRGG